MEMDSIEHMSYVQSVSNLAMLKAFHDAGCNLSNFKIERFIDDHHRGEFNSFDILIAGMNQLFGDSVKSYHSDEAAEEELIESELHAEFVILWEDKILFSPLNQIDDKQFDSILKKIGFFSEIVEVEMDCKMLPSKEGIIILFEYVGIIHELVNVLLRLKMTLQEMRKGRVKIDGYSSSDI